MFFVTFTFCHHVNYWYLHDCTLRPVPAFVYRIIDVNILSLAFVYYYEIDGQMFTIIVFFKVYKHS